MATTELVAFTTGYDESAPQSVGSGEYVTVIPIFQGRPGAVQIAVLAADDSRAFYRRLDMRHPELWR